MSTKLTLTLDKAVIAKAKEYAKSQGRSLSKLIEDYLKTVTGKRKDIDSIELSPVVASLLGSVKVDDKNLDYKEILTDELMKKYLK